MSDLLYDIILPSLLVILFIWLYIVVTIKTIKVAKKMELKNTWLLWIPFFAGYTICEMADSNLWIFAIAFISVLIYPFFFIYIIIYIYWQMRIMKKLGYPRCWGLLGMFWNMVLDIEYEEK